MDRSPEVIWGLTKRFNCYKTKFMGKHWSYSPFSMDGRHNAQQAANTLGVNVRQEKTTKGTKRTFTMTLKKAQKNGISKTKTGSQANPSTTVMDIGRCPNRAAQAI